MSEVMVGQWDVYPHRDSKLFRYVLTRDGYIVCIELPSPDFTGILAVGYGETVYYIHGIWVEKQDYEEYEKSLLFNKKIEKLLL